MHIYIIYYYFHGDFFPKLLDFYDEFHYVTNNIAQSIYLKKSYLFHIQN